MNRATTHVPVRVPGEGDFDEDDEFLADPLLDALFVDVIGAYDALRHIEDHGISVAVRWKKKGGKSHGKLVYGKCVKPSGLLAHFCKVDFVIWLAADNVAVESWSTVQIGKLLYHECLPAGTQIAAPEIKATSARWYSGQMVEIATASGHLLAGTPNHPVLTTRGWVPFDLLQVGDDVVRCGDPERVAAAVDPHKYQTPAAIEEVVRSLDMVPRLVPPAAHDLHANRPQCQVDVVAADRRLLAERVPAILEHGQHVQLGRRRGVGVPLTSRGHLEDAFLAQRSPSVRFGYLPKLRGHAGVLIGAGKPELLALGVRPDRDASRLQAMLHEIHADPEPLANGGHRLAGDVRRDDLLIADGCRVRSRRRSPDVNPSAQQELGDGLVAHAQRVCERLSRVPGQVMLDKVVRVSRRPFSGHVYNLQTSQEWYIANGIVVHNCRHIGWDEGDDEHDPHPVIMAHDLELFLGEIADTGAWERGRDALAKDFQQPDLAQRSHER